MDVEIQEFEAVAQKRLHTYASTLTVLKNLKSQIQSLSQHHASPAKEEGRQPNLLSEWKNCNASLSNEWKEDYVSVAKLSKVLDRKFKSELNQLTTMTTVSPATAKGSAPSHPVSPLMTPSLDSPEPSPDYYLGMALVYHFYRNGQFHIGDSFLAESGLSFSALVREDFCQLYRIIESMREGHQLDLALEWALANQASLERRGSRLIFQLHKLNFLWLCRKGEAAQALQYAKQAFSTVLATSDKSNNASNCHLVEIQKLMGALLYVQRPTAHSPYRSLFEPELPWLEVETAFIREYCCSLGLPTRSPLEVVISSGLLALPRILKINSLMKDKGLTWTTQNELPIEIDLDPSAQFHSVFSCPVLREPSSAKNPPMMLPCGHVISKEALGRLAKGSTSKFKCPYCPGEAILSHAVRVYI